MQLSYFILNLWLNYMWLKGFDLLYMKVGFICYVFSFVFTYNCYVFKMSNQFNGIINP